MNRNVSTPHLVVGIVFCGLSLLWLIAQATDASVHDTAPGFPLVLIGAGVIGLIATFTNSRNRRRDREGPTDENPEDPYAEPLDGPLDQDLEPTTTITEES